MNLNQRNRKQNIHNLYVLNYNLSSVERFDDVKVQVGGLPYVSIILNQNCNLKPDGQLLIQVEEGVDILAPSYVYINLRKLHYDQILGQSILDFYDSYKVSSQTQEALHFKVINIEGNAQEIKVLIITKVQTEDAILTNLISTPITIYLVPVDQEVYSSIGINAKINIKEVSNVLNGSEIVFLSLEEVNSFEGRRIKVYVGNLKI